MAYLDELGSYQAKALRTARGIVELETMIASATEPAHRERLQHFADRQRAMLSVFESAVSFLKCCIEVERKRAGLPEPKFEADRV